MRTRASRLGLFIASTRPSPTAALVVGAGSWPRAAASIAQPNEAAIGKVSWQNIQIKSLITFGYGWPVKLPGGVRSLAADGVAAVLSDSAGCIHGRSGRAQARAWNAISLSTSGGTAGAIKPTSW